MRGKLTFISIQIFSIKGTSPPTLKKKLFQRELTTVDMIRTLNRSFPQDRVGHKYFNPAGYLRAFFWLTCDRLTPHSVGTV